MLHVTASSVLPAFVDRKGSDTPECYAHLEDRPQVSTSPVLVRRWPVMCTDNVLFAPSRLFTRLPILQFPVHLPYRLVSLSGSRQYTVALLLTPWRRQ